MQSKELELENIKVGSLSVSAMRLMLKLSQKAKKGTSSWKIGTNQVIKMLKIWLLEEKEWGLISTVLNLKLCKQFKNNCWVMRTSWVDKAKIIIILRQLLQWPRSLAKDLSTLMHVKAAKRKLWSKIIHITVKKHAWRILKRATRPIIFWQEFKIIHHK